MGLCDHPLKSAQIFPSITCVPCVSSSDVISKLLRVTALLYNDLDICLGYFPIPCAEEEIHPGDRKLAFITLVVLAALPVSL